MDIANGVQKMRKYVASLSVATMMASMLIVPAASAQTYSDMGPDDSFYTYVEEGVQAGYFTPGDKFYGQREANRAEFAKATVAAAGVETTPGATTSFTDMVAWANEYVAALVGVGAINGYSDAAGNSLNKFGPGDKVTRGQAAKILSVAFALSANTDCGRAEFSDVPADNVFHDYVMTMACWSVINGYANSDMFGVNDPMTRGQMAKMLAGAANPVEWTDGSTPVVDTFDVRSAAATTLTAVDVKFGMDVDSVTAGNVANYAIVDGASNVLKVTAAVVSGDMVTLTTDMQTAGTAYTLTVTGVTAKDGGALEGDGKATFSGFTVVLQGSAMVELAQDTPAAGTHADLTAYNPALKFNVTAGSDSDVTLTSLVVRRGGISVDSNFSGVGVFDANGIRHGNFVTFADGKATINFPSEPITVKAGTTASLWIKTNLAGVSNASGTYNLSVTAATDVGATGVISGTFPVMGNTFTIVDGNATVGTLSVDAVTVHNNGVNDATAVNINLGTKDQDVARFRLVAGSNEDVVVSKITVYNNGNSNDGDVQNIRLVGPDGAELSKVTQTTNRYAVFDLSASPYPITKGNTRDLTVRVDVVGGSTRTVRFLINNDYDVEVMGQQTSSGILATAAATVDAAFPIGDANGGGSSCAVLVTCINKITVNSGTVLFAKSNGTPSGSVSVGATNATIGQWDITAQGEDMEVRTISYTLSSSLGAVLASGALTGTIKVKLDGNTVYSTSSLGTFGTANSNVTLSTYPVIKAGVKSTMTISVDVLSTATAGTTLTASLDVEQVKRLSTNDLVNASVSNTSANALTIATPALTVGKNSAYSDTTLVSGISDGVIGSFTLSNTGTTEDITVSGITLGLSNTTNVSNVYLKSAGVMLGTAITAPASSNAISISNFKVLKGSSATIDVYATSNSATTGTEVASISAITATGADSAVTVTATGVTATGQTITWTTAGTLTVALDGTNTPVSQILHSGQVDTNLLATRLQANNAEDVKVSVIQVSTNNGTSSLKDLKLFVNGVQVGNTVQLTKGVATFTNTSTGLFTVAKNSTATMYVKGTTTSSQTINSQAYNDLHIDYIEALGVSGGAKIKPGTTLTTAWTATNTTAAGASITVTDTTGFHAGDVVYVYDGTNGGSLGMVTTEPTSTTAMTVATLTAKTFAASATVSKIASGATTAASAGASGTAAAGVQYTVTTTKAFSAGDPVLIQGATTVQLGYVASVDSATTMTARALSLTSTGTAARISKIGTDTLSTGITATTALTTAAVATTVTSTTGFSVGDLVLVQDNGNSVAGSFGVVTAIGSSTGITLMLNSGVTPNSVSSATLVRVGSANPATTLVTTAASAGTRAIAATATTVSDTTGFGATDVVVTTGTGGAELGKVSAVASTTSMSVNSSSAVGGAASRVTRLPGAAAAGKVLLFHDVEPTITAKLSASDYNISSFTASAGQITQEVAKFDIKADGDRDLSFSSIDLLKSGSNAPQQYVTQFSLWNGSSQLAKVNTTTVTGTMDGTAGNADTTLVLVSGSGTAAGEIGGLTAAQVASIKAGDKLVITPAGGTSPAATTATVSTKAGTFAASGTSTLTLTFDTTVTIPADSTTFTIHNYRFHFDANQAQSGDIALAPQTVTAGSTLTLTVKADTTGVKTGVSNNSVTFGVSLPGTQGPNQTDGGFTWSYTPIGGSAISSLVVSDNYPVNAPTFSY